MGGSGGWEGLGDGRVWEMGESGRWKSLGDGRECSMASMDRASVLSRHNLNMIAQWENEGISLPVLSVARVMIAQWENE